MATSKTVSSVSNSNKQNTNKESVSYLILYTNYKEGDTDTKNLDYDDYLILNEVKDAKDMLYQVRDNWNQEVNPENLYIIPFKVSQIKRMKQTLELV